MSALRLTMIVETLSEREVSKFCRVENEAAQSSNVTICCQSWSCGETRVETRFKKCSMETVVYVIECIRLESNFPASDSFLLEDWNFKKSLPALCCLFQTVSTVQWWFDLFDLFDFHFRVFGKFSIHSNGSRAISPLCVCSTVFHEFAQLQDNYLVDKTARNTSKVNLNFFLLMMHSILLFSKAK